MNIIFLGPAGSGKSTQAKLLSEEMGCSVVSAGDIAYYASQGNNEESKKIKETMLQGELLTDELMLRLVEEHLKGKEHSKGTILDGFPRTLIEAKDFSWPIEKVIYINVPDDVVTKRLLARGRIDDTPEVIKKRLDLYHEETVPVLNYYKEKGALVEIDGSSEPSLVFEKVKKICND